MTQPSQYSITLVGCGKMGTALIHGWMAADLLSHAEILDPSPIHDSLMIFQSLFHVKQAASLTFKDTNMVILAVKPQIMTQICTDLKESLPKGIPVLSIAAGKNTTFFQGIFGNDRPIIRSMPNTPAAIGQGMSALYATRNVNDAQKIIATNLLGAVGKTIWLDDEGLMDAVTAVSGSGPAYVFHMIEAMAAAGEKVGLSQDHAMQLARQTIIGAAGLAASAPDTPASILRENVTSPNGTTEAALKILMDGKFQEIMDQTIDAATKRGKELAS